MTKRKVQAMIILIFTILSLFSYKLGAMFSKNYRDYQSQQLKAGINKTYTPLNDIDSDGYPDGGNKGLKDEDFIMRQKPLTHDSILYEEIAKDERYQLDILSGSLILDDDRDDLIVSNIYNGEESVEAINQIENNKKLLESILFKVNNPSLEIDAKSAILMDYETKDILYYKNPSQRMYPASTTKIMTAIIALTYGNLSDEIEVGEEINLMASDSSRAYLNEGEVLTLEMLLEGLMLPSGNDAAYTIARYIGGKIGNDSSLDINTSIQLFVNKMNAMVKALGLIDTHFMNPDGYDHMEQYTTAYDMALIAREALKYDELIKIVNQERARNIFITGEDVTWKSGNKLITKGSGVYYPYAIGLKSGTSSLAGRCLVSAGEKDERTVISVVLNSTAIGRWEDSLELLQYGLK